MAQFPQRFPSQAACPELAHQLIDAQDAEALQKIDLAAPGKHRLRAAALLSDATRARPIEIDGLPIKNGDVPWRTVSHNQRVMG